MEPFHEKLKRLIAASDPPRRQAEVARRIGSNPAQVSRWVNGAAVPDLNELRALADLFKVPVIYLVDDAMEEPAPASARRELIAELIAKLGEEAALDRLSLVPATAPEAPPARRPSPHVRVEIDGVERTPDYVKPPATAPAARPPSRRRKA